MKNTNPHYIYVDAGNGTSKRVAPGQVVSVDGDVEKNLKATSGVESASESDYKEYVDSRSGHSSEETDEMRRNREFGELRAQADQIAVAAPLQVVVGDDDAPYGPPSGTITTKEAIVKGDTDPQTRERFADHEKFEGELGENASEVEKVQAERKSAVNAKAEELLAGDEKPKRGRPKKQEQNS